MNEVQACALSEGSLCCTEAFKRPEEKGAPEFPPPCLSNVCQVGGRLCLLAMMMYRLGARFSNGPETFRARKQILKANPVE